MEHMTQGISQASAMMTQATQQIGKVIVGTTLGTRDAIATTATQTAQTLGNVAIALDKTSRQAFDQATHHVGRATETLGFVNKIPFVRQISRLLRLDWLVSMTDHVDVVKAKTTVAQLQERHPEETPRQIAQRIIKEKATYAGGLGLATSFIPGEALALFAVDLATTTALQTEMVYQIAAAYGFDLKDPARKGEILTIFALSLGGSRAVKAGLVFFKSVPLAGAVIGAGANATMLYTLGYAACRFYEAKQNDAIAETSPEILQAVQADSEHYIEQAIAQQTLVDQLLAHMVQASDPTLTGAAIAPKLTALKLSQETADQIAQHISDLPPLNTILAQLNPDFAVLALSRCDAIARIDGVVTPAEQAILKALTQKYDLDLESIHIAQSAVRERS